MAAQTSPAITLGLGYLAPPADLLDEERALWTRIVNSKPAEWFSREHEPLLLGYVRQVLEVARLQQALRDVSVVSDLKRYEQITRLLGTAQRTMLTYARSMRLTQQAQMRATKAATLSSRANGARPWDA